MNNLSELERKVLIVTGPSGVGKTYLAQQLLKQYPSSITEVKIFTTRKPRSSEIVTDRIFISRTEFEIMKDRGLFWFWGEFHNNLYGYTTASLQPTDTHLIVNVWPYAITKFCTLKSCVVVGLTIHLKNLALLKARMLSRGDSEQTVSERIPLIRRDVSDLKEMEPKLRSHDRLFYIKNDDVLRAQIMPWIKSELDLEPERGVV